MRKGKLTILEIAMIETISIHSTFLKREVEDIYRKFESYDITIAALIWANIYERSPQDYHLKLPK